MRQTDGLYTISTQRTKPSPLLHCDAMLTGSCLLPVGSNRRLETALQLYIYAVQMLYVHFSTPRDNTHLCCKRQGSSSGPRTASTRPLLPVAACCCSSAAVEHVASSVSCGKSIRHTHAAVATAAAPMRAAAAVPAAAAQQQQQHPHCGSLCYCRFVHACCFCVQPDCLLSIHTAHTRLGRRLKQTQHSTEHSRHIQHKSAVAPGVLMMKQTSALQSCHSAELTQHV